MWQEEKKPEEVKWFSFDAHSDREAGCSKHLSCSVCIYPSMLSTSHCSAAQSNAPGFYSSYKHWIKSWTLLTESFLLHLLSSPVSSPFTPVHLLHKNFPLGSSQDTLSLPPCSPASVFLLTLHPHVSFIKQGFQPGGTTDLSLKLLLSSCLTLMEDMRSLHS